MLQRSALVILLLLISAATAIFAAGHFGVRLPWEVVTTDEATPVAAKPLPETQDKATESTASQDRDEKSDTADTTTAAATDAIDDASKALAGSTPPQEPTEGDVAIDIARIAPDGTSVFAGRAQPESYVTVFEDGKPAGTVKAGSDGEWSLATEHKFASLDPKLTYEVSRTPPAAPEPPAPEAPAPVAEAEPAAPAPTAASVASDVMRKFEKLVADAREEAKKQREAAATAASQAPAATEKADDSGKPDASKDVAVAATSAPEPSQPSTSGDASSTKASDTSTPGTDTSSSTTPPVDTASRAASAATAAAETGTQTRANPSGDKPAVVATTTEPEIIPVPIMFVYNEATLTSEGKRAADLLLEYLTLKSLSAVELTGHADERGTSEYNFDLSRERLETVSRLLREGGYGGELKLSPKGKTEPYKGVDRTAYKGEALYQLDRRVELRVTR